VNELLNRERWPTSTYLPVCLFAKSI